MAEEKGPTAPPGLKIVVVGPTQGGKTTVSNYIASDEAVDFAYPFEYNATVGVRILECERNLGGPATPVEVWDVGGSTDYEGCWPAIMHDAHGVVLVYNPEQEGQVSESGAWYEYFVQNNDLPDEACVVFAFAPNAHRGTRQRVSPKISTDPQRRRLFRRRTPGGVKTQLSHASHDKARRGKRRMTQAVGNSRRRRRGQGAVRDQQEHQQI